MFSGFMVNAWTVASIVAVVAGLVGFFTVLRGSAFVAHAIPNGVVRRRRRSEPDRRQHARSASACSRCSARSASACSAGAGATTSRPRSRSSTMLGLGALFVSLSVEYAPEIYSLLFGEILGVSTSQLVPTVALAVVCVVAITLLYRPLMLSSLLPDVAEARGIATFRIELAFLAVVALATTMTVPVVGTLLIFA